MKRITAFAVSVLILSGFSVAAHDSKPGQGQSAAPGYGPSNTPEQQPGQPADNQDKQGKQGGPGGNLPDLPDQASDTARQVIDTIGGVVDPSGGALGEALQSLFGGGPTNLNETNQGSDTDTSEAA